MLSRVRQLTGKTRFVGAPVRADATVTKRGAGELRLRLVINSGQLVGTRDVEGASCKDLVGAAAVSLAVLLRAEEAASDPAPLASAENSRESEAPTDSVSPSTTQPAPTSTPPSSPAPGRLASDTAPVERRWRLLLLAPSAAARIGPERKPSVGLALAGGVSLDRWRFHAEAKLWAAQNATTTSLLDEYTAKLDRFSVSLRTCRAVGGRAIELSTCALVSLQHLSVRGQGPHITSRTSVATWIAAGAGLQLRAHVASWVNLVAGIDGELQFSRPKVVLDGIGLVDQLRPVGATLLVGSEWIL